MKAKIDELPTLQFQKLPNDAKVWRYMDFSKFTLFLENKALFFCRSDKLGDPFEGSYPTINIKNRPKDAWEKLIRDVHREIRKFILVNCWSNNDCESAAFWKLYTNCNEGVALQSTFGRLQRCFGSEGSESVKMGKVNYIDFTKDSFDEEKCLFSPYAFKMKSFEFEREVRAVMIKAPEHVKHWEDLINTHPVFDVGGYISVDLDILLENVYVAPMADFIFRNKVEATLKRHNINSTPKWTDLHNEPIY
jgi:hypothetical protein